MLTFGYVLPFRVCISLYCMEFSLLLFYSFSLSVCVLVVGAKLR